ncbi:hypothetical protein RU87_GL001345 [Lactococcus plantarum]|uniref:Uncharacterized protein n=1 Tax=Pseudolactococcus plantarum TaxID=1365 RepID=A0A2A5S097_9LACT|nr:hypothetical protein RU87_GL001345 [Lactococcus plantarum]
MRGVKKNKTTHAKLLVTVDINIAIPIRFDSLILLVLLKRKNKINDMK